MVTYAIEALVKAGITEIMLVTGGTHAGEFLRLLGNGHEYGIDRLLYAYQERPGRIVEAPDDPPSTCAVTGIYCYDETVFEVIPTLTPSRRGELEITDVNNFYVAKTTMEYDVLDGFWGDAGESIDAYYQVNDFVRRHGANKG